ncbi:hypothetical protein F5Y13DRAFT_149430 [Hypoxylon sp. FL1857]|nr:hypothetical protein F5Y13DRAFT_149430 [Hypoxylon sp. FL1857]
MGSLLKISGCVGSSPRVLATKRHRAKAVRGACHQSDMSRNTTSVERPASRRVGACTCLGAASCHHRPERLIPPLLPKATGASACQGARVCAHACALCYRTAYNHRGSRRKKKRQEKRWEEHRD